MFHEGKTGPPFDSDLILRSPRRPQFTLHPRFLGGVTINHPFMVSTLPEDSLDCQATTTIPGINPGNSIQSKKKDRLPILYLFLRNPLADVPLEIIGQTWVPCRGTKHPGLLGTERLSEMWDFQAKTKTVPGILRWLVTLVPSCNGRHWCLTQIPFAVLRILLRVDW